MVLKLLQMKDDAFAVARGRQKTEEHPGAVYRLLTESLGQHTQRYRLDTGLDLSVVSVFFNLGLVLESKVQSGQSGRCMSQDRTFGNAGRQNDAVHTR